MLTGVHHWIWGWFITQHFCSNSWNTYISWVRKLKSKGLSYFFKTSQRLSSNGRENHVIDSISHRLVPQIFHSTFYSRTDTTSTRGAWNATTPWNWVGLSGSLGLLRKGDTASTGFLSWECTFATPSYHTTRSLATLKPSCGREHMGRPQRKREAWGASSSSQLFESS